MSKDNTPVGFFNAELTIDLLNENDEGQELYADSAYTGENQKETISSHKMINKFTKKDTEAIH
jgi:hypothetical protein